MSDVKMFVAVKAFLVFSDKVLLLREAPTYKEGSEVGKYVLPGGRIKPGERFDDSFIREIKEETGLDVKIGKPFFMDEWRTEVNGEQWQIVATYVVCHVGTDQITLSEDHDEYEWIFPEEHEQHYITPEVKRAFEAYMKMEEKLKI